MNKIMVNASSKTYPIYFEHSFGQLEEAIKNIKKNYSSFIIVSDSNVESIYAQSVQNSLESFGKKILSVSFEAGEKQKNIDTISHFYSEAIQFGADRKSLVLALGGGVVGDMAGFFAATFMRGIDFVQIPTTLLSQVDSSVGGKTGIDFDGYKNIVGAFYQPEFVFINVSTLETLPKREFYAGMAEVVKHGIIREKQYFDFLKNHADAILTLDHTVLKEMIKGSCSIKKSVVDEDEKEHGIRGLLNFGHTLGHSIERLKEFQLIHGECVSIGMKGELMLSEKLGYLNQTQVQECLELIEQFNLPVTTSEVNDLEVYEELFHDKKTTHNRLVFAVIDEIGKSHLSTEHIDKQIVLDCIKEIIN